MGIREKTEAIKQKKKELATQLNAIGTKWWGEPGELQRAMYEEYSENPGFNAEIRGNYQRLNQLDYTPFQNLRIAVKNLKAPETEAEAKRMTEVLNQLESLVQKARKVLETSPIYGAVLKDTEDDRSYFVWL